MQNVITLGDHSQSHKDKLCDQSDSEPELLIDRPMQKVFLERLNLFEKNLVIVSIMSIVMVALSVFGVFFA